MIDDFFYPKNKLNKTGDHPEKSQTEEFKLIYKGIVKDLKERIKHVKQVGADQGDKAEFINNKSGYTDRIESLTNEITNESQGFLREFYKKIKDVRETERNASEKRNSYISMLKEIQNQKILSEHLKKVLKADAKYVTCLTACYKAYGDVVESLDGLLKMQRCQNGLSNQEDDISNNITLTRVWNFIEQEKEKILRFEDEMINLSNKSYGIESEDKEKREDKTTKKVNVENQKEQKGNTAFGVIFTNAGNRSHPICGSSAVDLERG